MNAGSILAQACKAINLVKATGVDVLHHKSHISSRLSLGRPESGSPAIASVTSVTSGHDKAISQTCRVKASPRGLHELPRTVLVCLSLPVSERDGTLLWECVSCDKEQL